MKIRATLGGDQIGPLLSRQLGRYPDRVRAAARAAAAEVALNIEDKGRENISSAGKFGSRWTDGFKATVSEGGGWIKIAVTEDVPYWTVFEYGADIRAKNPSGLLWIPLTGAGVPQGVWPRDYPGRLFRVERGGRLSSMGETAPKTARMLGRVRTLAATFTTTQKAPLLMDADSKQPKYFGKPYVNIPRKFNLRGIVKEEVQTLPLLFRTNVRAIARIEG
jgi:hypothetical protein